MQPSELLEDSKQSWGHGQDVQPWRQATCWHRVQGWEGWSGSGHHRDGMKSGDAMCLQSSSNMLCHSYALEG